MEYEIKCPEKSRCYSAGQFKACYNNYESCIMFQRALSLKGDKDNQFQPVKVLDKLEK